MLFLYLIRHLVIQLEQFKFNLNKLQQISPEKTHGQMLKLSSNNCNKNKTSTFKMILTSKHGQRKITLYGCD